MNNPSASDPVMFSRLLSDSDLSGQPLESSNTSSTMNSDKITPISAQDSKALKHKRRFCKVNGCERIVKSQGLCQRHGAKPKKCKVDGCSKQAQGNFDGMCKSHFKAFKAADSLPLSAPTSQSREMEKSTPPPPPSGESVYDKVIPESIAWCPRAGTQMPLVAHLKAGFDAGKPLAWHRNEERRARGLWPITSPATHFEAWERELVWTEILILTGNPQTSFRHLARAWGRDKGFQTILSQFICERKGSIARKASGAAQRPLGQIPSCVEITHTTTDSDPQFEDSTTTSGSEEGEGPGGEGLGESMFKEDNEGNATNQNQQQLAEDMFIFPPGHQNHFASFQFDSAMLDEIDRDAAAIIASDDEDYDGQKKQAI